MKTRVYLECFDHDCRVSQNEITFINLAIDLLLKRTGNSPGLVRNICNSPISLILEEKIETQRDEE